MKLLFDKEIYQNFLLEHIPKARQYIWITTADIKDLHIEISRQFKPFLDLLNQLVTKGIKVRLLHAKEPGPRFRAHFDSFPNLIQSQNFERVMCPRQHSKIIIIDGKIAYLGSANLTGAGMGARGMHKCNFEAGVLINDIAQIKLLQNYIDKIFTGKHCLACKLKNICPDPIIN